MSVTLVEKVCVLGAGSTKYGKLSDSITDIATQASVSAIENAGINPKDIKASYISNVFWSGRQAGTSWSCFNE